MFGVETCSFLPDDQSDRRDFARQGETSHRRFHAFGEQRAVELLKGSCGDAGQSGLGAELGRGPGVRGRPRSARAAGQQRAHADPGGGRG